MSYAWTPEQHQLLRRLAGTMSASEIARRVSEVGPARTVWAVKGRASLAGITLRAGGRIREPWNRFDWTPPEEALLAELAGQVSAGGIAERLNVRFGTRRTESSVRNRAQSRSISLRLVGLLSQADLTRILPVHNRRIDRWARAGTLRAVRRGTGQRGSVWWFRPADVEVFLKANPHLFDWRRVKAGRWRDTLRAIVMRDPWLTVSEVTRRTGTNKWTLTVWLRSGLVPGAHRADDRPQAPWRVPASALETIERLAGVYGQRGEAS